MPAVAYRTSDLVLASVLWLEGYPLELELEGRRAVFAFSDTEASEELQRLAMQVVGCKYTVEPLEFTKAMAEVRTRLYRFLEENGQRQRRAG